ncbi:HAD family hydrolase [Actinomadura sp. DC4]|uniref:HAD family hydrolase n=1 Tax=Actinomadura sp. DC4 TaxID=3055069 RepID=UPI0025B03914|nr:HAD family hydrolase [Actinomadura sp. DC4]MDN3355800.1 hydrolase [Actinomadura sp. DC4]
MRTTIAQCVLDDLGRTVASVIFGVDGVVVDSDRASAAAWKSVFDPFLRSHAMVYETLYVPFDVFLDHPAHMRGRPPLDGARDFLASRGIRLPYVDQRVFVVRHEEFFRGEVRRHGVSPVAATVAFVRELRRYGVRTAAVSERCCGSELLRRAGVAELFDVLLDGLDAPGIRLPATVDAALFEAAARRLGEPPERTAVIEGSTAGVAAGRYAGFGAVVGVDPTGGATGLGEQGADLVVTDVSRLRLRHRRIA